METNYIFVVDDDEDDRVLIQKAFLQVNTQKELRFFTSGKELLEVLPSLTKEQQPELFILDLNMPALDGKETLANIREMEPYKTTPVVVYSTTVTPHMRHNFKSLQVFACLQKGVSFEELQQQAQFFCELIADGSDTILGNY